MASCGDCYAMCEGSVMKSCTKCGFGCYSGTGSSGDTACSQMCVQICVGECAGSYPGEYDIYGSRCDGCQTHCDDSCTGFCIQPVGFDSNGSTECAKDGNCNVQCAKQSGGNKQSGYCPGECIGYCLSSCTGFSISSVIDCEGSSGDQRCVNKCHTTCWTSCTGEGCTHSCGTSSCRLLCSEIQEMYGGSGPTCLGCDVQCDDNSGSSGGGGSGDCGTCWGSCTDNCSEQSSCDHKCMNQCNVLCDDNCDRVCIEKCSDHCTYSCSLACSGCDNYCTACDQSCQDACIVTCFGQCAACRVNCSGMSTSETDCMKMCRACTSMCIDTCVNSCITWNSGGTQNINGINRYISNATYNDWRGFSASDAPRDGNQWYGPTTNGYQATVKSWSTIVNKYPTKPSNRLPLGYGVPYKGILPPKNVGSSDGSRGDWDYNNPGEYEWYHNVQRPDDDIDWDMIRNL